MCLFVHSHVRSWTHNGFLFKLQSARSMLYVNNKSPKKKKFKLENKNWKKLARERVWACSWILWIFVCLRCWQWRNKCDLRALNNDNILRYTTRTRCTVLLFIFCNNNKKSYSIELKSNFYFWNHFVIWQSTSFLHMIISVVSQRPVWSTNFLYLNVNISISKIFHTVFFYLLNTTRQTQKSNSNMLEKNNVDFMLFI